MSAVTQWFDGRLKPVRVGLYERDWETLGLSATLDYFDGEKFTDPDTGFIWWNQNRAWRGLADDPAKPQPDQPAQEVDK